MIKFKAGGRFIGAFYHKKPKHLGNWVIGLNGIISLTGYDGGCVLCVAKFGTILKKYDIEIEFKPFKRSIKHYR